MKYINSYKFLLVPPVLKIDSRKEKNDWREFIDYIDNFKHLAKKGRENEKLKGCEQEWWEEQQGDTSEPISEIIKIKKWSKLKNDKEGKGQYEDEDEDDKEQKNFKIENDSSSYLENESDGISFSFINYNLAQNNIYSNGTDCKNVTTEKKCYNYSSASKNQKKNENIDKIGSNILGKTGDIEWNKNTLLHNQNKKGIEQKKKNLNNKNGIVEQIYFTHTDNEHTVLKNNYQENMNINKNLQDTPEKVRSSTHKSGNLPHSGFIFESINEKKRKKYKDKKELAENHTISENTEYDKITKNYFNNESLYNEKTVPSLPPFRNPRKMDTDNNINYEADKYVEMNSANSIEYETNEDVIKHSTKKTNKTKWTKTNNEKYKLSENNIKSINARKSNYIDKPKNQKGNGKGAKKNNTKIINTNVNSHINKNKNIQINKWKKTQKEKKAEIDGFYAYNYAYLKSDNGTSFESSNAEDTDNENDLLTNIQNEITKYSLKDIY